MKINILLIVIFFSLLIIGGAPYPTGITGVTKLTGGAGCACHNFSPEPTVSVWFEGPDSIEAGQSEIFRIYISGGAAVEGGFDVAAMFGYLAPVDGSVWILNNELTHTQPKAFSNDTVYWEFSYTAPITLGFDTLYAVGNSVNDDGIPNSFDKWNFSENTPIHIVEHIVPVELTSFTATAELNSVSLNWQTATETNNSGFEIERKQVGSPQSSVGNQDWNQIAFVPGFGTTTEQKSYSFVDENLSAGTYQYRLKQLDFDGSFEYSNTIEVEITSPTEFALAQNYPNPFNPTTKIKYTIPSVTLRQAQGDILVSLKVFDVLGNEVATLVNETQQPGIYEVEFNVGQAISLSSGVYYYQLRVYPVSGAVSFVETKKMILLR